MDGLYTQILTLLKDSKKDLQISEIASHTGVDRHTAAKHLEALEMKGLIRHKCVGKAKLWIMAKSPLISLLQKKDLLGEQVNALLESAFGSISIQDADLNVIYRSGTMDKEKGKCYESHGNVSKCDDCPVEKTFVTGKSQKSYVDQLGREVITHPVKDSSDEVVAVFEMIKR